MTAHPDRPVEGPTKQSSPATDPHTAALSQVEHGTVGQQERVHTAARRDAKANETKALKDDLAGAPSDDRATPAPDTRTQAEKFADAAREHEADDSEDAFKGVLRKLAKPKMSISD